MNRKCPFCEIARSPSSEKVVYRDEDITAFLDKRPLFLGHLLLIPNEHVTTLGDLDRDKIYPLFSVAQCLSRAVPSALGAVGSFVAMNNIVSQSVPHLHIHIVPRNPKDGLRGFFWPRKKYDNEEQMNFFAKKLREAVEADMSKTLRR